MISLLLLLQPAFALDDACTSVSRSFTQQLQAPAILVLGERHGTQPDQARVQQVIRRLAKRAPITLGLEALHHSKQRTLDRFADGELNTVQLMDSLPPSSDWSFTLQPSERLITSALKGYEVLAIRPDLQSPRRSQPVPVPAQLDQLLSHDGLKVPINPQWTNQLSRSVAWYEHRLAKTAIQNWSKEGFLILVVDRSHVEGGLGVAWQAKQLSNLPVYSVTVAWANTRCYENDWVWRRDPLDWLSRWLNDRPS